MFEREMFKPSLNPTQKAQLEVALLLAMAKGKQDALDYTGIMRVCTQHLYIQNISEQVLLGTLVERLQDILAHGDVCRINEIARVINTPDQRLETMDFALKITFADDVMNRDVNKVLMMLQTAFDIGDNDVNKLVSLRL